MGSLGRSFHERLTNISLAAISLAQRVFTAEDAAKPSAQPAKRLRASVDDALKEIDRFLWALWQFTSRLKPGTTSTVDNEEPDTVDHSITGYIMHVDCGH